LVKDKELMKASKLQIFAALCCSARSAGNIAIAEKLFK